MRGAARGRSHGRNRRQVQHGPDPPERLRDVGDQRVVRMSPTHSPLPRTTHTHTHTHTPQMMKCNLQENTCFTAWGSEKDGIFQRSTFLSNFRRSTATLVNRVWKARDPAAPVYSSGDLRVSFDRVVTRTDPFHQPEAKATITDDEGKLADVNVPDANTWNVLYVTPPPIPDRTHCPSQLSPSPTPLSHFVLERDGARILYYPPHPFLRCRLFLQHLPSTLNTPPSLQRPLHRAELPHGDCAPPEGRSPGHGEPVRPEPLDEEPPL